MNQYYLLHFGRDNGARKIYLARFVFGEESQHLLLTNGFYCANVLYRVCKNRPECVIFDGFILVTKKAHAAIAWASLQYCNLKS